MSALTVDDIDTAISAEPRIMDEKLAAALGFERPRDIRKLVERHEMALTRFGEVCRTVRQTSAKGGRPGKTYWLNLRQALYLATKSEAENAVDLTVEMVDVFAAAKEGRAAVAPQVKVLKERRSRLPALARRRPGRFEPGSDLLKDLCNVVRSAIHRTTQCPGLGFDTALHQTLEDIQARKQNPGATVRGAVFDYDEEHARDEMAARAMAAGTPLRPNARPKNMTDVVQTRTAH